jgi:hypothetical protein
MLVMSGMLAVQLKEEEEAFAQTSIVPFLELTSGKIILLVGNKKIWPL